MGKNTELEDVPQDVRFPVEEDKVLAYWDEIDAFQTSLRMSREKKNPAFTFYDGPPFATGMPHYGHILAGTIKDCVTRYWHMNGFHVERRWGWDTHGLPIEFEIDQKLKIKGRQDVLDMTVKVYNAECRAVVMKYASEWKRVVRRLARWIDMENDYKTLDPTFMESVWWVCKQVINVVYACVRAPAPTLRALAPILEGCNGPYFCARTADKFACTNARRNATHNHTEDASRNAHAHAHMHIHNHTRVHTRAHTHTHAHMHMHMHIHRHAHTYSCTHARTHARTNVNKKYKFVQTRMHRCRHTHTYTHTHTHNTKSTTLLHLLRSTNT